MLRRLLFTMIGPGSGNIICLLILALMLKKKEELPTAHMPQASFNNQSKNTNLINSRGIMAALSVYIAAFATPVIISNLQILQSSSQFVMVTLVLGSWSYSIFFPVAFFIFKKNALRTVISEGCPSIVTIS